MIDVRNVSRRYGSVVALDGVSFQIDRGAVVGFLGPNGAGKSTTMRILTGLLAPTRGAVHVAGIAWDDPRRDFRSHVGYLPESAPLHLEMRVRPYLRYVARLRGVERPTVAVDRAVEQCGLAPMLGRRLATLSKGYRQRVGLAQAILHTPDILILDEPTSGLDPNQMVDIRALIRALGADATVLISSHVLPEVEAVADRVLILHEGRLVADEPLQGSAPGARIRATVATAAIDPVVDTLRAHPAIETVTVEASTLHITGDGDLRAVVARLIVEAGVDLLELRAEASTLADRFRALTGADR